MSSRSLRPRGRKIGAAALSATLGLAGLGMAASPVGATEATTSERLAGIDRYTTAIDVSQEVFTTSDDVVLARGDVYADALAGNGVAGAVDAPILLTQSNSLDPRTAAEIERLGAGTVYIMGGTEAISQAVEDALAADHTVVRIEGVTRIETAVDAAEFIAGTTGGIGETDTDQTTAILVNGYNFPDAVSASPAAYNLEIPVMLTTSNELSDATAAALQSAGIERVLIVGGTDAVSAAVEAEVDAMGITTDRYAGINRYLTATDFATDFLMAELGWDGPEFDLATGEKFPDALTGGPHAGTIEAPILLTMTETLSDATEAFLTTNCAAFDEQFVLGGTAAVSDATEAAAQAAAQCDVTTNQTFTASPAGAQTSEAGTVLQYSFSGLTPGSRVDIQLVDCSNIATDANGVTTFSGTNPGGTGNVAQNDNTNTGSVTVVNGVASAPTDEVLVPTSGTVTFSVDTTGDAGQCFVAVVFNDANDNDRIELNPDGTPSEAFGNSGDITVIPVEAADNTAITGPVQSANPAGDFFTANGFTYYYDANDEFILEGGAAPDTVLTMEQFEARVSSGDGISGTYRSNPANQSSFLLDDVAPLAPTVVDARNPTGTRAALGGIEVFFNDSATATTASYNVLRATATQPTVIGQPVTCPDAQTAAGASAYTVVGTVADTTAGATDGYIFHDTTATPPAAGQTAPQYCYTVQAVDVTGDTGPLADEDGPATAQAPTTTQNMSFEAAETVLVNATTIRADYNNNVNSATVAANGSDFRVTHTEGGVSTNIVVTGAAVEAGNPDAVLITTATAVPTTGTVTVTSQTGTDGNTVCAGTATTNCQPAGQSVIVTNTGADTTAPTTTTAAFSDASNAVFTMSENIAPASVTAADFSGTADRTGATIDVTNNVITLTLAAPAASGETVVLNANSVTDTAGNPGPATAATATAA